MKKIAILSLALLLTTFFIYIGCKKESKGTKPKLTYAADMSSDDQNLISMFANVGTLHNQGLDFIYNQLLAYKNAQIAQTGKFSSTTSNLFNLYNQYTVDYLDTLWNLPDTQYNGMLTSIKSFDLYFFKNGQPYTTANVEQQWSITYSAALINDINIIFAIGDSSTLSDSAKYAAWDTLLVQNLDSLTTDVEKGAFIAGINTAIASYQYWQIQSNDDKWTSLFADITQARTTMSNDDKEHWKADVEGAIGGAVTYGMQGAVVGLGGVVAGAVGGAVLGACTGTAGHVIKSLIWSWLWN